MRITFVYHNHDQSILRWRVNYLAEALVRHGIDAQRKHIKDKDIKECCLTSDVVVFYRSNSTEVLNFLKDLQGERIKIIYDIDDYIFQENCKFSNLNERKWVLSFMSKIPTVMSSTNQLLEVMPEGKHKILRENAIDLNTYNILKHEKVSDGFYNIGWLVGVSRYEMRPFIYETLKKISSKIANVKFTYFGKEDDFLKSLQELPLVVNRLDYIQPYYWQNLYKKYKEANMDIVINPLDETDIFAHCRSHLKFIETYAYGVPLIHARTRTFQEVITEGHTGFFASTPEEYVEKLILVKNSPELVKDIVENARKILLDRFIIDNLVPNFLNSLLMTV